MTLDAFLLALAVLFILLAGLLVMAETAIARVSRSRVEELVDDGVRGAPRLLSVVEDRPRYVNVLLFLNSN